MSAARAGLRVRTAYHEAGHAVIDHAYGCELRGVSIIRRGESLGRCESISSTSLLATLPRRRALRTKIVMLFAGMAAEARLLGALDVAAIDHAGADLRHAAELATQLGVPGSLEERMRAAGRVGQRAHRLLRSPAMWSAVEILAAALLARGVLTGVEATALIARAMQDPL